MNIEAEIQTNEAALKKHMHIAVQNMVEKAMTRFVMAELELIKRNFREDIRRICTESIESKVGRLVDKNIAQIGGGLKDIVDKKIQEEIFTRAVATHLRGMRLEVTVAPQTK